MMMLFWEGKQMPVGYEISNPLFQQTSETRGVFDRPFNSPLLPGESSTRSNFAIEEYLDLTSQRRETELFLEVSTVWLLVFQHDFLIQ